MNRTFITAAWAVALTLACGGRQAADAPPRGDVVPERLYACDTLLSELQQLDVEAADEASLGIWMRRADQDAAPCYTAYTQAADGVADEQIARHRARQLTMHALRIELALSRRFDGMANYCAVLGDTFQLLLSGVAEIDTALRRPEIREAEARQLQSLADLDIETLDILIIANEAHCDGTR